MNDAACNLCGETSAELIYREAHGYLPGAEYRLMRCQGCGLLYSHPSLPHDYSRYPLRGGLENVGWEALLRTGRGRTLAKCLELIEQYAKGGRLLEVGFGAGLFAVLTASQGWDYHGVDVSAACARFLRSRGFKNGPVPGISVCWPEWDCATGSQKSISGAQASMNISTAKPGT